MMRGAGKAGATMASTGSAEPAQAPRVRSRDVNNIRAGEVARDDDGGGGRPENGCGVGLDRVGGDGDDRVGRADPAHSEAVDAIDLGRPWRARR